MRIASDPARRLELPGAGVVARPLEVTPQQTGWDAPTARAYDYRAGQVVDGEAEADEMVMLLLRGDVELEADGLAGRCTRTDPFTEPPVALYLPPGGRYRATVRADAHVLYCRAPVRGDRPARIVGGDADVITPEVAERLRIREQRVAAGTWTTVPPGAGGRGVVYHRFSRPDGWALRVARDAGDGAPREPEVVRDGDAFVVAHGSHELVVAPGATLLAVAVAVA